MALSHSRSTCTSWGGGALGSLAIVRRPPEGDPKRGIRPKIRCKIMFETPLSHFEVDFFWGRWIVHPPLKPTGACLGFFSQARKVNYLTGLAERVEYVLSLVCVYVFYCLKKKEFGWKGEYGNRGAGLGQKKHVKCIITVPLLQCMLTNDPNNML